MNNNIRNNIQNKLTNEIIRLKNTIVYVSLRLGKTKIALDSIQPEEKVLVVYPNTSIKQSWLDDIEKFPPKSTNITFVTKASIHKYINTEWDYLILDELPLMQSDKQIKAIKSIKYIKRIALSGVMNNKTEKKLKDELGLTVGIRYSMEDAINDGLVKDYRINLHFIDIDNSILNNFECFGKQLKSSEKKIYEFYSEQMDKAKTNIDEGIDVPKWTNIFNKYMSLRTNFLYNSITLYNKALELTNKYKNEKLLIYTMRTDIADNLSTISYHSKNKEEEVLESFKLANSGHLAVVNSVSAGITIKRLHKVLFHSYTSNTETVTQQLGRSLLWEFEGEYSEIHMLVLKNTQMELWADKACNSLNQFKINYIINNKIYSKIEYIKLQNPDKKLYLYKGSIVYYSHEEQNGVWTNKMYKFLGNENNTYNLNPQNLIEI